MNSCVVTQVQVQVGLGTHNYPTFVPELVIEGGVVGRHLNPHRNVLLQLVLCRVSFASVLTTTHPSQSIFKRTGWRNKSISSLGLIHFQVEMGIALLWVEHDVWLEAQGLQTQGLISALHSLQS